MSKTKPVRIDFEEESSDSTTTTQGLSDIDIQSYVRAARDRAILRENDSDKRMDASAAGNRHEGIEKENREIENGADRRSSEENKKKKKRKRDDSASDLEGGFSSSPESSSPISSSAGRRVRARRWVLTLNNPTETEKLKYNDAQMKSFKVSWLIAGLEGAGKTPHLQMACAFQKQIDLAQVKKTVGMGRSHVEMMRGSIADSVAYCSKEKLWYEFGDRPVEAGMGPKKAFDNMVTQIKTNIPDRVIFESNPNMFLRYRTSIGAAKQLYAGDAPRKPVEVYWYWGETGAGKSFRVEAEVKESAMAVYRQNGSSWWDGYDSQPAVIIDDLPETKNLTELLKELDVYNYLLGTKGSHTWMKAEKIWVTSSFPPSKIDKGGQLARRIKVIDEMKKENRPDIRSLFSNLPPRERVLVQYGANLGRGMDKEEAYDNIPESYYMD